MEHEDPFEPDVKARLAQNADMLSRYRTSGVPVHDVLNWRLFAHARGRVSEPWGRNGGEATGGNYSTVKSAQRLRATLSIGPRGRVQVIDM